MGPARTGPGRSKDPFAGPRPGLSERDPRSMTRIVLWIGVRRAL